MRSGKDRLTGLYDRDAGYAIAGKTASDSKASNSQAIALWVDINRFRAINHSFGHLAGDYLVQVVAERIAAIVDNSGYVARMSGDEFLLILGEADLEYALSVVEQLEQSVSSEIVIEGVLLHPTLSTGIALLNENEDPVQWVLRADRAKNMAKKRAGNSHYVSGERPHSTGHLLDRAEFEIEAKLHKAIETGGISLHYQPIIRLDGEIEALEALIRCYVDGEFLSPGMVIPVAEKTGLIIRLGEWVMSQGATLARKFETEGKRIKVAINVSRAQLLTSRFADSLQAALLISGVTPELLELELTESLFLDGSPQVQANLKCARESGVCLAIDDFGTGYSTLATLKDIPASKLKLDKTFVDVLPGDARAAAVVRAIATLGRDLGMTVVAEGVERSEQRDCLEKLCVDALQGYLVSRPLPIDKLVPFFNNSFSPPRFMCQSTGVCDE